MAMSSPEQILKVVGARHKVALAVHFDQHANLAAGVDVGAHRALRWWSAQPSSALRPYRACAAQQTRPRSCIPWSPAKPSGSRPSALRISREALSPTWHQSSRSLSSSVFSLISAAPRGGFLFFDLLTRPGFWLITLALKTTADPFRRGAPFSADLRSA